MVGRQLLPSISKFDGLKPTRRAAGRKQPAAFWDREKMKLLNTTEAARCLNLCTKTMARMHARGVGPRSVSAGGRRLYLESEIQSWLAGGGDAR